MVATLRTRLGWRGVCTMFTLAACVSAAVSLPGMMMIVLMGDSGEFREAVD